MSADGFPLTGVRVLDLSRILAGPVCTQLLADLGADVVKVERPGAGDDTRQWGPPFLDGDGPSAYYLSANRNKRSLALDLRHAESRAVLHDLLRRADVMVENFLPDAAAKFGLLPEQLRQVNPRLVSCSISAFGRSGPWAQAPGYDLMIQATSGLMAITGEPEGAPMKVGVAISDVITGLYAAASVLAGLAARGTRDTGWNFDLALSDCTLASLVNVAQSALVTGKRPTRYGNAHPQIVPYEVFATADGHVVLAVGADRQWERFCIAVERGDWAADPRFATNPARVVHRRELVPLLEREFAQRSTGQWEELLRSVDIPHARVLSVDEALTAPQAAARDMVCSVTDRSGRQYSVLGGAVHWQDQPPQTPSAPPDLGEHTDEVLAEWLGYAPQRIAELRRLGATA